MTTMKTILNIAAFKFAALALVNFIFIESVASQTENLYPVPDSYQVEGIPPIKKSDVDHLFYDPASIRSNLIWDVGRKNRRLLVTDQTNNIYVLDSPSSQPEKLIEKVVPASVKVRPDGGAFAYSSDLQDADNFQLFLYDFDRKASSKIIELKGKDESIDSFVWSRKGDSIYYIRADYDLKKSTLCNYDFKKEICSPTELKSVWEVLGAEQDKVLLKYWKASSTQHLYVLDMKTGQLTPIDETGNCRRGFFALGKVFWTTEGNGVCEKEPCILSMDLRSKKASRRHPHNK